MITRCLQAGRKCFADPLFLCLVLAAVMGAFFLVGVAGEWAIRTAPLPAGWQEPPAATPVLTDRRGVPLAVLPTESARANFPLALSEMGLWLPLATVAIEDRRFFAHPGVDLRATIGAALRNLRHRRIVGGGSTITQQLVKLSYPRRQRGFPEKAEEALGALKLERSWRKDQILEAYLNRLDYGNRRIGPEAAAQAYFGVSARDLTLPQAIFLAGLPQSPSRLNPWKNPEAALDRYRRNVRRMASRDALPDGWTARRLLNAPPKISRHDPPFAARHFVELLRGGKQTMTSLDLDLQQLAEAALHDHLTAVRGLGGNDAAVVILDNATGEVRALACAGNPRESSLNAATTPRSCGSTLKPFVYLAALESRRFTAASLLPDTPDAITAAYADYDPQNYSNRHLGPVRLRRALGNSLNVPAVAVLSQLGARDTFAQLRDWGLQFPETFDAYGAGFLLGNAPVRLLDLAAAYAALARGGEAWAARLTPRDPVASRTAASPEACAIVTDILCDNRARRDSFGTHSPLALPERTAVKTGTSSGFRDGWCVGFNKNHTVAVWAGNLNGQPMAEALAVQSAAPLWAVLMKALYARGDEPLTPLRETNRLRKVAVDAATGLLPVDDQPAEDEWFLADTEPAESAASWYEDGRLVLPAEYTAWCASAHNHLSARVRDDGFHIVFPQDGAVFEINPALPPGQQILLLQSTRPDCEWFLNGKKLDGARIPLRPGRWALDARYGGHTASVSFVVE